ncbi:MAG: hypothetical protein Q9159_005936 [Coniocarpon cinnabarinum]
MATSTQISTVATSTTTATTHLPVTSIPLFLPSQLPVASAFFTLPNGVALGGISSADINFLGSVIGADATAATYELDCATASKFAPFRPPTTFSCPYSGATVTSGPSIFQSFSINTSKSFNGYKHCELSHGVEQSVEPIFCAKAINNDVVIFDGGWAGLHDVTGHGSLTLLACRGSTVFAIRDVLLASTVYQIL